MSYFKSFTFAGKRQAGKALDAIEDNSDNDYLWIDDVAVISVNKRGHYRVHSTWAQDSDNVAGGIGFGAILAWAESTIVSSILLGVPKTSPSLISGWLATESRMIE